MSRHFVIGGFAAICMLLGAKIEDRRSDRFRAQTVERLRAATDRGDAREMSCALLALMKDRRVGGGWYAECLAAGAVASQ